MRKLTMALALSLLALLALAPARAETAAANADVEKAVASALAEKLGSDAQTIKVAYYDGKVLLSGKVTHDSTQELAKEVALYVPGVKKVENEVESTDQRAIGNGRILAESNDSALEGDVKTALRNTIGKTASDIEVETCDGLVSVRGTVPDKARHDLAIGAAQKVKGVKGLVDLLRVAG